MFFAERFPAVRNIFRGYGLRFQIFELLTIVQMEEQVLLVGSHLHASFRCPNNTGVFKSFGKVVDKQILHDAGFPVFFLDVDVVSVDIAIEDTFRNIQFRRSLLHGYQQGPEFHLSLGRNDILKIEGHAAKHNTEDDERTDNPEQRNSCRFHGKKLVFFPEVSESHQCGQKDGQREGNRNQSQRRVKEELR